MNSVLDELRRLFGDEAIDSGLADGSITVYDLVEGDEEDNILTTQDDSPDSEDIPQIVTFVGLHRKGD